jgi:hypothetical protein
MRPRNRIRRPSVRYEPRVDPLEFRDLPTVLASHMALHGLIAHRARGASGNPTTSTMPRSTAHEQARETFGARFQGPFTTGPGRFKNDALLVHMSGGGTANQFLHGNVLIQVTRPTDPTQPVTGTAELFAKNVATTGTVLVLDLAGTAPSDPMKPPAHLTWTVNPSSGGLYTNSTGQGTLDLVYFPGGKRPQRTFQAGTAGAVFQGQINTTGVGNLLQFSG